MNKIFFLILVSIASTHSFAAPAFKNLLTVTQLDIYDPTTVALQVFSENEKSTLYPVGVRPAQAIQGVEAYSAVFRSNLHHWLDGYLILAINYKHNAKPRSTKADWEDTHEPTVYFASQTKPSGSTVKLSFVRYGYNAPTTATKRFITYRGVLATSDGLKLRVTAIITERNVEPNGLKTPIWERAGSDYPTISIEPI